MKVRILVFVSFNILLSSTNYFLKAQSDSLEIKHKDTLFVKENNYTLELKKLILPASLISFGVASLVIPPLKQLNLSTRTEVLEDNPARIKWDNYTQYAPAGLVYLYNGLGIKGKHNFKDRTIILGLSQLFVAAMVQPIKFLVKEERPDNSNSYSFPSGHTATGFSTAQFMFREYNESNFWLSLSGFPLAAFTGIYRSINNKHWVGDVIAGAGFGILSTELAYWVFPKVQKLFKKKEVMVMPYYQNDKLGVGFIANF